MRTQEEIRLEALKLAEQLGKPEYVNLIVAYSEALLSPKQEEGTHNFHIMGCPVGQADCICGFNSPKEEKHEDKVELPEEIVPENGLAAYREKLNAIIRYLRSRE